MYLFKDGDFTFWTATYGSWQKDARVVFRVRSDNEPRKRAAEKGIRFYDRVVPSWPDDIAAWLIGHPDDALQDVST